ncbi:unnamed protein product, partial [Trichogramma brassicae]
MRRDFELDVNYIDEFGRTHFHAACVYGLPEIVKNFLDYDFNPTYLDNSPLDWLVPETKDSPLHLAVENGHMNVAELLMQKGASPNLGNKNGLTSLHVICKKNYTVPIPESKNIDNVLTIFFKNTESSKESIRSRGGGDGGDAGSNNICRDVHNPLVQ